jgi:hypothetical protein
MGRGLKVDTPHYNRVKEQLLEGKWDVSRNIPHRQILDYNVSENNWDSDEYDYPAFSQSVRNLVNDLRAQSLLPSNGEAEGTYALYSNGTVWMYRFKADTHSTFLFFSDSTETSEQAPPPTPAPMAPTMPSGEENLPNDEIAVNNLYHLLTWRGRSDKSMVTFLGKLPSGITINDMVACIENNTQLVIRYTEPEEMATPDTIRHYDTASDGSICHAENSTICDSMMESSFKMRGQVATDRIYSYQRVNLPFQVQSDFSSTDVPLSSRVVNVRLISGECVRVFIAHMQKLVEVSPVCDSSHTFIVLALISILCPFNNRNLDSALVFKRRLCRMCRITVAQMVSAILPATAWLVSVPLVLIPVLAHQQAAVVGLVPHHQWEPVIRLKLISKRTGKVSKLTLLVLDLEIVLRRKLL